MQKTLSELGYEITVDGSMGSATLKAINAAIKNDLAEVYNAFKKNRKTYYKNLVIANPTKYSKFEKGWENRVNSFPDK